MQQGLVKWLVSSHWKGSRWLHPTSGPQFIEHRLHLHTTCLLTPMMRTQVMTETQQEEPRPDYHSEEIPQWPPQGESGDLHSLYLNHYPFCFLLFPPFSLLTLNNTTFNMLTFVRLPNISGRILNFPLISLDYAVHLYYSSGQKVSS